MTSKRTKSGLTPLQEAFCHEYLVDMNTKNAFKRAGYKASGDDERRNIHRLMTNSRIQERIQDLVEERSRTTDITAKRVVLELGRIAFSDLREFMSWGTDGTRWRDSDELTDDAAAVVSEIYETEREMDDGGTYRTKRFKMHDKMAALKELAKHTGVGQQQAVPDAVADAKQKKDVAIDRMIADMDNWREEQAKALPEERVDAP